ncbi:eukaryotic translation initiation factor eIF2A, putative [Babesia caballi]|uniref:Eukaryotic translation initiation factor 2A n=1 Tax=Babesia caballi TaxID=5871 RepID=A0AAV4LSM9_BABCB|nr:eukaryotic translation initiation factor eIF2A, putative [Babesia caballi]
MDNIAGDMAALTVRAATQSPRDWYIVAHGKKVQLHRFSPRSGLSAEDLCTLVWEDSDITHCYPSHGGDKLCLGRAGSTRLEVADTLSRNIVATVALPPGCALSGAAFSPKDTFLVVHTAWSEANPNNLVIHKLEGAETRVVYAIPYTKSYVVKWYPIWTACETYCTLRVGEELLVWKDNDFTPEGSVGKITPAAGVEGAQPFPTSSIISVSPVSKKGTCYVALFLPNHQKFANGLVKIFCVADLATPVYEHLFSYAEEGEFFWNRSGTAAILRTFTNNVKGLSSYYGGNGLFLLHPSKGHHKTVMEPTQGLAHDVSWSQSGNDILIVKGSMPSELDMYDGNNGNKLLTFGRGNRNTIRRDPFDRLVLVAGFGNSSGDIDIWDLKSRRKIAQSRSDWAVSCEFSPDGRYFVTATTAPRMRVNNCFKVFTYGGKLVHTVDFDELYQVTLCAPGATFVERDPSPGACTLLPTVTKSLYRPPGSRGAGANEVHTRVDPQTLVATPVPRNVPPVPRGPPGADLTLLNAAARALLLRRREPAAQWELYVEGDVEVALTEGALVHGHALVLDHEHGPRLDDVVLRRLHADHAAVEVLDVEGAARHGLVDLDALEHHEVRAAALELLVRRLAYDEDDVARDLVGPLVGLAVERHPVLVGHAPLYEHLEDLLGLLHALSLAALAALRVLDDLALPAAGVAHALRLLDHRSHLADLHPHAAPATEAAHAECVARPAQAVAGLADHVLVYRQLAHGAVVDLLQRDLELRNHVFAALLALGLAPSSEEEVKDIARVSVREVPLHSFLAVLVVDSTLFRIR